MSRFAILHDRHRGERCVIVANGPSLNAMDLSFLQRETVIGLNKIFHGFEKFDFYPRYYVAVNRKVLEQSRSEEHTSELQSLMRISYAVFCMKKKIHNNRQYTNNH